MFNSKGTVLQAANFHGREQKPEIQVRHSSRWRTQFVMRLGRKLLGSSTLIPTSADLWDVVTVCRWPPEVDPLEGGGKKVANQLLLRRSRRLRSQVDGHMGELQIVITSKVRSDFWHTLSMIKGLSGIKQPPRWCTVSIRLFSLLQSADWQSMGLMEDSPFKLPFLNAWLPVTPR